MSSESFLLRVITPAGLQAEEQVAAATLPASDGQIGILPGHAEYTGLLGIGVLEYTPAVSDSIKRLVIAGGFCTFAEATLTIIADAVDTQASVDAAACARRKEELIKLIPTLNGYESSWDLAVAELKRLEAQEILTRG